MKREPISFVFNKEKYDEVDFVHEIHLNLRNIINKYIHLNDVHLKDTISRSFGFSGYDEYSKSQNKNLHTHEITNGLFYKKFITIINSEIGIDIDTFPNVVIEWMIKSSFISSIPIQFNILDIFKEKGFLDADGDTNNIKREHIINKIIAPAIDELGINKAHSISDFLCFLKIGYVHNLYAKLNKTNKLKKKKIMKLFYDDFNFKENKFSERAEIFWAFYLREYNSSQQIFNYFFNEISLKKSTIDII